MTREGSIIGGLKSNIVTLSQKLADKTLTLRYVALKIAIITEEMEHAVEVKGASQRLNELHSLHRKMKTFDDELARYRHQSMGDIRFKDIVGDDNDRTL